MTGNRIGPREKYVYENEAGDNYIIETDIDLAVAGVGSAGAAPVVFDPANPPAGGASPAPKRFKPRGVYVESTTDGARKFLICFSNDGNLYASTQRTAVADIDGDGTFVTTGRRGEQLTF